MFQGLLRLDRPGKVDQVKSTYRYTRGQAKEFNRDDLGHDGMEHLFHLLPVHSHYSQDSASVVLLLQTPR